MAYSVMRCPRCDGTWWREEVFNELVDEDSETSRAVKEGRGTEVRVPVAASPTRVLYVCGKCSFPKIEPQEPPELEIPEYVLVRR